ncbi:hypothetical protein [Vampirovibrio sp.]|uniref:hypothetical protein n=1 Tax=Vampirovibrio sp. TaxID=2717857 RepID=UPI00359342DB
MSFPPTLNYGFATNNRPLLPMATAPLSMYSALPSVSTFPAANPKGFSSVSIAPLADSGETSVAGLADAFYKATLGKRGMDEQAAKKALTAVYQQGRQLEFEQAVLQLAHAQGKAVTGVEDILQQELAGNAFKKVFLKAPLTECQDLWRQGQLSYRAKPWDYRLRGMWGALEHFGHVIKNHPAISLTAMAGVTALGHFKPVVGAASGAAIMGISAATSVVNEVKALNHPQSDSEKVRYYQKSGENLTAFLLTLVGVEGIQKGLSAGYKAGVESAKLSSVPQNVILRKPYQVWQGLTHKASGHEKMDYRQFGMFVLGLLDDSLLPFNWAAEKMQKNKGPEATH